MKIPDRIVNMCKCCQMCLETCYWNCVEERFCFDKDIAAAKLEDAYSAEWEDQHCYTNRAVSLDSVITHQPPNNNHLPPLQQNGLTREVQELPVMAGQIYEVFSKSMIFRDDAQSKPNFDTDEFGEEPYRRVEEPNRGHKTDEDSPISVDFAMGKPNRIVSFEDEVIEAQNDMTDFEIMFRDELMADQRMTKIEEEDERSDKTDVTNSPEDNGISMKPIKPQVSKKISVDSSKDSDSLKDVRLNEIKFGTAPLHKTKSLPRIESVKSILRVNSLKSMQTAESSASLSRNDSSSSLNPPQRKISRVQLARVESLRNIDTRNINKILSRLPQRSASFLSIPEHILQAEKLRLNKELFTLSGSKPEEGSGEFSQLSKMPDTPVIRSSNLPKFFEETPVIGEYKADTSLKSLQKPSDVIFTEYDYSMPRYYGKAKPINSDVASVHESKSMPDLRNEDVARKVSKRLVKLRSRLKPLTIKKINEEATKIQVGK